MSIESIGTLSGYFQTNDQPTQSEFLNLIHTSVLHLPISYYTFAPYTKAVHTSGDVYKLCTSAGTALTADPPVHEADECLDVGGGAACGIVVDSSNRYRLSLNTAGGVSKYLVMLKYDVDVSASSLTELYARVYNSSYEVVAGFTGGTSTTLAKTAHVCSFGAFAETGTDEGAGGMLFIEVYAKTSSNSLLQSQKLDIAVVCMR